MASEGVGYPVSLQWTIEESELRRTLPHESIRSKCVDTCFDFRFFLVILPFSGTEFTEIELHVIPQFEEHIECKFTITMKSLSWIWERDNSRDEHRVFQIYHCSSTTFFDPSEGFIVDGKFELRMDGIFNIKFSNRPVARRRPNDYPPEVRHPPNRERSRFEDYCNPLLIQRLGLETNWTTKMLGSILWENEDKDFTIFVNTRPISVHKQILAGHSPVFAGMFKSGMKEAIENSMEIPNYPFEVVEIIVKLCYDVPVTGHEIMEYKDQLFNFIDQYQMDKIKNDLEELLLKKINYVNVCTLANCALVAKAGKLEDACFRLLMECLKEGIAPTNLDELDINLKLKIFDKAFIKVV